MGAGPHQGLEQGKNGSEKKNQIAHVVLQRTLYTNSAYKNSTRSAVPSLKNPQPGSSARTQQDPLAALLSVNISYFSNSSGVSNKFIVVLLLFPT
jgi:hypothetical protein